MVKKRLVITDLTYMWDDELCIGGVGREGNCIRPITREGVRRSHIFEDGELKAYPRALVEFDLTPVSVAMPPHIEDWYFEPSATRHIIDCTDAQWEDILRRGCFGSVDEMFDGYLEGDRRVPPDADTRSLGTLCSPKATDVWIDERYGRQQFRLDFEDGSGKQHGGYPVNDLAFRTLLQDRIDALGDNRKAVDVMLAALRNADRLYLRIGLARPRQMGNYPMACWTQITGVYTFPDYLGGRTFADF